MTTEINTGLHRVQVEVIHAAVDLRIATDNDFGSLASLSVGEAIAVAHLLLEAARVARTNEERRKIDG